MPELSRTVNVEYSHVIGGGRAWRRGHAVHWAAVLFFVVLAWPFLRKGERGEWHNCFLRAAHRLQAGERIHFAHEPNAYAYPPAMAMFAVPLANLPFRASLAMWYLVNVAATSAAVACAWRLIGGGSLTALDGRQKVVLALGLLLAARFLIAPLENQQFDAVIAACLLAGCLALARGQTIWSAVLLGLAAAMKCTPLLFAPYLVWRGHLKAAAMLVFIAVAVNRLPDWFWPQAAGGSYLGDWVGTFLLKIGRTAPGVWDSDLVLNQSLSGMINRFFQAGLPLSPADLPTAHAALSTTTIHSMRLLVYGVSLGLAAFTAWRFGGPLRRASAWAVSDRAGFRVQGSGFSGDWSDVRTAIEASAIVCLMLLLSPMSSKAHYVVLLLPCLVLARAVVERRLDARWWLPPLLILGPLTSKGITGKPLGDLLLAWGFPTWFVIVLLGAMWVLLPPARFGQYRDHRDDRADRAEDSHHQAEDRASPAM
ncbi:MAG TPA: glycosyltransferase family 87 protein [Pirellulales bacterium]|nr:glycosyltransferase family 87 protein [Pirellulales bacterium]